jgi:hypothetical protein
VVAGRRLAAPWAAPIRAASRPLSVVGAESARIEKEVDARKMLQLLQRSLSRLVFGAKRDCAKRAYATAQVAKVEGLVAMDVESVSHQAV